MRIGGRQYLADIERRADLRAKNLRRIRDARGWLQTDMARRLGMPSTFVCSLETGDRTITLKTVDRLAAALDILAELDAPIAAEVAA